MPTLSIEQAMKLAVRRHQAGQLGDAERLYLQILASAPDHADALHLLGVVLAQAGKVDDAIESIGRAIAINPGVAEFHGNLASAYRQKGNLSQAIAELRRVTDIKPESASAWFALATALADGGAHADAIDALRNAANLDPTMSADFYQLGRELAQEGRLAEAHAALNESLRLKSDNADAWNNLGIVLRRQEKIEDAIVAYRRAIELRPDFHQALDNLGTALAVAKRFDEAIEAYQKSLSINPNYAKAHNDLGTALGLSGRVDEGIASLRKAIALQPAYAEAHKSLGICLAKKGLADEAIASYRDAIRFDERLVEAHYALGIALEKQQRFGEAIDAYQSAIRSDPEHADAYVNLRDAYLESGRVEEGISYFQRAAAQNSAKAHWNLGILLLQRGDFAQGWVEYEWRWDMEDSSNARPSFPQPMWDGTPFPGKTLLLHVEQGFGDTIQFIRYLPLVAQRGGSVVLQCEPAMENLLKCLPGVTRVFSKGALPPFDLHCPLLSLPLAFSTTLDSIPGKVSYLAPDAEHRTLWETKVRAAQPEDGAASLKVGLVWSGNAAHQNDKNRSILLADLAPLSGVKGVRFFSLQIGPASTQAAHPPAGMEFVDLTADIRDFADTAALIEQLDLVIAVDTATAHLAGALARPVWVMLPKESDFRWLLDRDDSPWYPTMRLFRQSTSGNWAEVIDRVVRALREENSG